MNFCPCLLSSSDLSNIDKWFLRNRSLLAVAATIATRNKQELELLFSDAGGVDLSFFSNSTLPQFVRHFLLKGTLQDVEVFQKRLRRLLGDATFLEAFMHSGSNLNSKLKPQPNSNTIPNYRLSRIKLKHKDISFLDFRSTLCQPCKGNLPMPTICLIWTLLSSITQSSSITDGMQLICWKLFAFLSMYLPIVVVLLNVLGRSWRYLVLL